MGMSDFRPNVALLLLDRDGRLLVCERLKPAGAWQFPQGGVDPGEDLEEALLREVEEEIGLAPGSYEIRQTRGGYRYFYPEGVKERKKGNFDGQEQTYFLCQLGADVPPINLEAHTREFRDYKWIAPEEFSATWLPEFKREVYRRVMRDFFSVEI